MTDTRAKLIPLQCIGLVLFLTPLLFIGIMYGGAISVSPDPDIANILVVCGIAAVIVGPIVRSSLLRKQEGSADVSCSSYASATIIGLAISESAATLAFVAYLMGSEFLTALLLCVASMIAVAVCFPRAGAVAG